MLVLFRLVGERRAGIVIKIRYADLPEGSHVDVKSEGGKTIIYLLPALSRAQRRAAFTKARQAARVGRIPRLPLIALMVAIGADRFKITLRAMASAARVHPVGFAVPSAIFVTAVILYTFVTSVTISLAPPRAAGPGPVRASTGAGSQATPGSSQPSPGTARSGGPGGPGGGARSGQPGQAARPGQTAQSAPAGQAGAGNAEANPSSSPVPVSSSSGSGSGPAPGSAPSPTQAAKPAPSPSPSGNNTGLCVQVGPIQVCANLP
jgi:hypothetical protein